MQFKNDGAGNQRSIYLKIRIFRRCPDQDQSPILYKRQKIILLPLIKPVDLINKKNRLFTIHSLQILRRFHDLFHILFSGYCRIDLLKFSTCRIGDHFCKGGLSGSRRAVKDQGTQLIRLDRPI